MASKAVYNEAESKRTEQAYLSPEIVRQRERTLTVISPQTGEQIVDVGCGPGLLAYELAGVIGNEGRVVGIDSSSSMIALAEKRCSALSNVTFIQCDATDLTVDNESADVVACTQVLLYVDDVEKAIAEFSRVLKPGGRVIVMETDWRSAVLNSDDEVLTEKIIEAWDRAVPSPRLPARLGQLLREAGFSSVQIDAIPIISTSAVMDEYAMSMMTQCAQAARKQGVINKSQGREWISSLQQLGVEDAFFFCVNRFLFSAVKRSAH